MTLPRLDELSRLAVRYGSDKFGGHLYTPIYHRLFRHLRERPIHLLEIGIGGYGAPKAGGASLRMWAEYFPYGRIVGLDIEPKELALPPRIVAVQGSQTDRALLERLTLQHGPFNIIIDDGSHAVPHVLQSFHCLFPLMPDGGLYVVEDTQTAFLSATGGNSRGRGTVFDLAHRLALAMHYLEGYQAGPESDPADRHGRIAHSVTVFRNLIVFERGDNSYPSNIGLDFSSPLVREAYAAIEAEAADNPSPRSALSRIDMDIWGKRIDQAAKLALAAAAAYPDDMELLHELIRMMHWAGRHDVAATLQLRLSRPGPTDR